MTFRGLPELQERLRRDPGDDEAWTVLADWLMEHGDRRGHLVGAGIEPWRWHTMGRDNQAEWLAGLDLPSDGVRLSWKHGFVVGVSVTDWGATVRDFVDSLLDHPTGALLGRLTIVAITPAPPLLAEPGLLRRFRGLHLDPALDPVEQLPAFLGAPELGSLVDLHLPSLRIGRPALEVLASSPTFGGLTRLFLGLNPLGDDGMAMLAGSAALRDIEELRLGSVGVGPAGLRHLVRSPGLESLSYLDLFVNAIGDEGADVLARSGLRGLRRLQLGSNRIGPSGLTALARSPVLRTVTRLGLALNQLDGPSVLALATSPHARALQELNLRANRLDPDVVREVRAALAPQGCEVLA